MRSAHLKTTPRVPLPAAALADNDAVSSRQRRFWQIEMQQPDVNKTRDLTTADCPVGILSVSTDGDLARSTRWREVLDPGGIGESCARHSWRTVDGGVRSASTE